MKDKTLLARLRRKDAAALSELIDKYSAYVGTVVYGICAGKLPREDMEELAADIFLTLWKSAATLRADTLTPWLGAVARNAAKNRLRQQNQESELFEDRIELPDVSPEEKLSAQEERGRVLAALEQLAPADRDVFVRHYYWRQTVKMIANETGINENTVKTRLVRGREKLRAALSEEEYND
ncbi:MAG: sigma-70 family RNA polymerase sigma factor [Oscillospiraceae bacterium]|nr:sigma-70 family RNA polymerase sigma factor [Oscillospiraceae bacterium]